MALNTPTADPLTAERLEKAQELLSSMPGELLVEKLTSAFWHLTIAGGLPGDAACAAFAVAGTALCLGERRYDVRLLTEGFSGNGSPPPVCRKPHDDDEHEPRPSMH